MVDLARGSHPTARLLDLVPGRSGKAYRDWLDERGDEFRKRVEIATLDLFQGYKNAIDDQLEDATCVLDAFHIVKLAGAAVDDVRRRIQQAGGPRPPRPQGRPSLRHPPCSPRREAAPLAAPADPAGQRIGRPSRSRCGRGRLPLRPGPPRRVPPAHPRTRTPTRRAAHRHVAVMPDPRDCVTGQDPASMADSVPGLLRYPRREQRRHPGHQRDHRAGPPHRPRVPQRRALPPPHAPHHRRPRRLTPHSTLKSRLRPSTVENGAARPGVDCSRPEARGLIGCSRGPQEGGGQRHAKSS